MLKFLEHMEIVWPYDVKLSAPVIRRRLEKALDFAQDWAHISGGETELCLSNIKPWSEAQPGCPVFKAARRTSFYENGLDLDDGSLMDFLSLDPPAVAPFLELRKA